MNFYRDTRSFFLPLSLLLILYAPPCLSSLSGDGEEVDLEMGGHLNHDQAPGVPCSHKPDRPYTMQDVPPALRDDPRFNYLKSWGYRYWVLGNVLATVKYTTGTALLGTTNAALWGFVSEDSKEGLNIATTVLAWSVVLLKSFEAGASAKAKRYKKEAKDMIAEENLKAGTPLQNLPPRLTQEDEL
tara:strand:+ start:2249 stop:2806 length:558 start_codon:yes stop_codon:yes gene_type:complete